MITTIAIIVLFVFGCFALYTLRSEKPKTQKAIEEVGRPKTVATTILSFTLGIILLLRNL